MLAYDSITERPLDFRETEVGVPQGGNLSPLLANIMLNELDHELERRGHRFVRYADDMVIFCKSKRAAERILENILPYIEGKLFLRVNREKTKIADIGKIKFLGYGFYYSKTGVRATVHAKSKAKLEKKVREITVRSNGKGYAWKKKKLKETVTGWVNYFKQADMKSYLTRMDEWLRTRLPYHCKALQSAFHLWPEIFHPQTLWPMIFPGLSVLFPSDQ